MSKKKFKDKKSLNSSSSSSKKPKSKKSSYLWGFCNLSGQLPNLFIILKTLDFCSANLPFKYIYIYSYT